jgi:hypothetical protein
MSLKLNLNYQQMPVLAYSQRQDLPAKPGIYYVGNSDCPVMYIGLSQNLRNRHLNHHRQEDFEEIENAVIRYQVVTEDLIAKISNLAENLRRLEKQAINYYQPELNQKPVQNKTKLSNGAVYIQTHQVGQEGYCSHFDAQNGDELAIGTNKLNMITRAIEQKRPIFLIASGYYEDYEVYGYPNLAELPSNENKKIYLLISRFIPDGYEFYQNYYSVYGGNSQIFIKPYVILNNIPGFDQFKKSYLSVGFTNCEKSPFAQELLNLGNFQLL